ncbi:10658_t:CDS:2 [Paraglomus occultum]|uniref:10658_t:CDS:1 n=1 Tax=Paraglomus occultum TaxID=144539 RepID=A0A9N8ZNA0_9GLOM|nr:10658_t:CDS:2 [Paraglomus occultum]
MRMEALFWDVIEEYPDPADDNLLDPPRGDEVEAFNEKRLRYLEANHIKQLQRMSLRHNEELRQLRELFQRCIDLEYVNEDHVGQFPLQTTVLSGTVNRILREGHEIDLKDHGIVDERGVIGKEEDVERALNIMMPIPPEKSTLSIDDLYSLFRRIYSITRMEQRSQYETLRIHYLQEAMQLMKLVLTSKRPESLQRKRSLGISSMDVDSIVPMTAAPPLNADTLMGETNPTSLPAKPTLDMMVASQRMPSSVSRDPRITGRGGQEGGLNNSSSK